MTWLKTHDGEYIEPWVLQIGNAAYGALKRLEGYCAHNLTDGNVPPEIVALVCQGSEGKKSLLALEIVGRARRNEMGAVFLPFFLDHNPTRAKVEAEEAARKAKGRHAANARWHGAPS